MFTKLLTQPKHPNAIDINSRTLEYTPLGSPKWEWRLKLGLCFKCGSKGYILKYYSIPIPKYEL